MPDDVKQQLVFIQKTLGMYNETIDYECLKNESRKNLENFIIEMKSIVSSIDYNNIFDYELFILVRNIKYFFSNDKKIFEKLSLEYNELNSLLYEVLALSDDVVLNFSSLSYQTLYECSELLILILNYYCNNYNRIMHEEADNKTLPFNLWKIMLLMPKFNYVDEDSCVRRNINVNIKTIKHAIQKRN